MGTQIRVTHLSNGKSGVLRINDRGPYTKGRVIDVTEGVAMKYDAPRSSSPIAPRWGADPGAPIPGLRCACPGLFHGRAVGAKTNQPRPIG